MLDEEIFNEWKSEQYKDQSTEEKMEFIEHLHTFPQYFKKTFLAGLKSERQEKWHDLCKDIGCPCEKYKSYKDENAELEKENAELKDKLEVLIAVGNTCTKGLNKQLTKAKEIIKNYMTIAKGSHTTVCGVPEENRTINVLKLNEEAEQFLNSEVDESACIQEKKK